MVFCPWLLLLSMLSDFIVSVFHICFSVYQLVDIWVISTLWLLWIMLLSVFVYRFWTRFNFFWVYPRSVLSLHCAEIRRPIQLQFSWLWQLCSSALLVYHPEPILKHRWRSHIQFHMCVKLIRISTAKTYRTELRNGTPSVFQNGLWVVDKQGRRTALPKPTKL